MSDPKRWLELGLIYHLTLKQWKRGLRLLQGEDKLWEGHQERQGKQGLFSKVCYADLSRCLLHLQKLRVLLFQVQEREASLQIEISFINVNFLYKKKTCALFLELFLYLLLLSGFWLKIIHMPYRHMLGWHILGPFMTYCPYLFLMSFFSYKNVRSMRANIFVFCSLPQTSA